MRSPLCAVAIPTQPKGHVHGAVRSLEFGHRAIARVLVKARRPRCPLPRVVIIDLIKVKVARRLISGVVLVAVVGTGDHVVIVPLPVIRGLTILRHARLQVEGRKAPRHQLAEVLANARCSSKQRNAFQRTARSIFSMAKGGA